MFQSEMEHRDEGDGAKARMKRTRSAAQKRLGCLIRDTDTVVSIPLARV
jgi:hypothetical protein